MKIDIVSDIVCPWCIVGYKQLARALEITGVEAEITWHPFELNPNMPQSGQDLLEHLSEKYGTSADDSARFRTQLLKHGGELGFTFNYSDNMRMRNTFAAHQLLHWAKLHDAQHALKLALFAAHFTDGKDINDPDVLADVAAASGLDRADALNVLSEQTYRDDVRAEQKAWLQRGIQGVPAIIFERMQLVTGAQGVENYVSILKQLTQNQAA